MQMDGGRGLARENKKGWRMARGERYTRVAIILHWTIAALIIFNLAVGFFMEGLPLSLRLLVVDMHMSSGMSVLALTVIRVAWRLLHEPPPYPAEMHAWERHAARFAHFFLYAVMVLMPLTGWAIISALPAYGTSGWHADRERKAAAAAALTANGGFTPTGLPAGGPPSGVMKGGGLKIWWTIPMPRITPIEAVGEQPGGLPAQDKLRDEFIDWHSVGGYLTLALLLLHIAGALKHQIIDKQPELARMGIGRGRPDLE